MTLEQLALGLPSSGASGSTLLGQDRPPRHQRPQWGWLLHGRVGWVGVLLPTQEGDQGAHPQLRPEKVCPALSHSTRVCSGHIHDHTCACVHNAHKI